MAGTRDVRCEHGFTKVCGVCDPYVASRTDPRDVAWPVVHCRSCGCTMFANGPGEVCSECAEGHDRGIRLMCLAHTLPEPCPACAAYIAGGL